MKYFAILETKCCNDISIAIKNWQYFLCVSAIFCAIRVIISYRARSTKHRMNCYHHGICIFVLKIQYN